MKGESWGSYLRWRFHARWAYGLVRRDRFLQIATGGMASHAQNEALVCPANTRGYRFERLDAATAGSCPFNWIGGSHPPERVPGKASSHVGHHICLPFENAGDQ
jgi:hypothetical protein